VNTPKHIDANRQDSISTGFTGHAVTAAPKRYACVHYEKSTLRPNEKEKPNQFHDALFQPHSSFFQFYINPG
jgi:hypothetical protein